MMKIVSLILFIAISATAQIEHAPTVAQCQADQRLWEAKILNGPSDQLPDIYVITDWSKEMSDCLRVDPTNQFKYYVLGAEINGERLLRLSSFVQRHNLYAQFVQEDKAGKR